MPLSAGLLYVVKFYQFRGLASSAKRLMLYGVYVQTIIQMLQLYRVLLISIDFPYCPFLLARPSYDVESMLTFPWTCAGT